MKHILMTALAVLFLICSTAWASTWYVNGVTGSDSNSCTSPSTACKTIGHTISLTASGDTIIVAPAIYTENLTISIRLNVIGSGAPTTIIDGEGVNTVVTISSGTVTLSGMTIRNGHSLTGGGGIKNYGTLTLSWSTVNRNSVGGSRFGGLGGGLSNSGTLTINNSTISGNAVNQPKPCEPPCLFAGNAISNSGTLNINNSTITGNNGAGHPGGAIYNSGTVKINNTTVSGNSVRGIISHNISGSATATLQNSIVANNSGGNCFGSVTSNGYNLSSDGTCNFNNTGDMNNTNPVLGILGNYGGPTQTIPLLSGSPAIDAGNPSGCTNSNGLLLKTDQRGQPHPNSEDTGRCDMGAYERQSD